MWETYSTKNVTRRRVYFRPNLHGEDDTQMTCNTKLNAGARCTHCGIYIQSLELEAYQVNTSGLRHKLCGYLLRLKPHPSDIKDPVRREQIRNKELPK